MTITSATPSPTQQTTQTILGVMRELSYYSGAAFNIDLATTINTKRGVYPSAQPSGVPRINTFGIGIGGCYVVSAAPRLQLAANGVLITNMDLYQPIPFRCVPVEQDLTPAERANYRMRENVLIGNNQYWCYYHKLIDFGTNTVQLTKTDSTTNLETAYQIDYSNMNPTPPVSNVNGVIVDTTKEVNATVTGILSVTGAEVIEYMTIMYGDLTSARVSEFGLYSGQDQQIALTATDSYVESIYTQMNVHHTFTGDDFSNPTNSKTYTIRHGAGSVLLVQ